MRAPRPTSSACRIEKARANRLKIDWASYQPPKPTFTGARVFRSYDVGELVPYIDWTPFFQTWELKGRFPAILDDAEAGRRPRASSARTRRRCSSSSWRSAGSTRRP